MDTINDLREKLKDKSLNLTAVADASGIAYHVLWRFRDGATPSYQTVALLEQYFAARDGGAPTRRAANG